MSWSARATKALLVKVRKAGFLCDDRMRSGVDEILARGNGKRSTALLHPGEVLQTMLDAAASPDEIAFRIAEGKERTRTACLVTRTNYARWVVGVTSCNATKATPAGCDGWDLEKWRAGGDNRKLLDVWGMKFDATRLGVSFKAPSLKGAKATVEDRAHEAELLAQIITAPDDDGPRLVFADWLAERDPPRSEFIVLQCQANAMRRGARRSDLELRANELRITHGDRWLPAGSAPRRSHTSLMFSYQRGFPAVVSGTFEMLAKHAKALFAALPIEQVCLIMPSERNLESFLAMEEIDRLTGLELVFDDLDIERVFEMLARSPRVARIVRLTLSQAKFTATAASILARPSTLPSLTLLQLESCDLAPELRAVIGKRPGIKFVRG